MRHWCGQKKKKKDGWADNDRLSFQNKAWCEPSMACHSSDIKLRSQANAWINENINMLTEFDMNGMDLEEKKKSITWLELEHIHRQQISTKKNMQKKKSLNKLTLEKVWVRIFNWITQLYQAFFRLHSPEKNHIDVATLHGRKMAELFSTTIFAYSNCCYLSAHTGMERVKKNPGNCVLR